MFDFSAKPKPIPTLKQKLKDLDWKAERVGKRDHGAGSRLDLKVDELGEKDDAV